MSSTAAAESKPVLLSVVELGGYPNFAPLYRELGFEVVVKGSVRKALAELKQRNPRVVVAEYNFQSDYRDRTSNLETLLAITQRMHGIRVIVFYELEFHHQLEKLTSQFPIFDTLAFPIQREQLENCLRRAMGAV